MRPSEASRRTPGSPFGGSAVMGSFVASGGRYRVALRRRARAVALRPRLSPGMPLSKGEGTPEIGRVTAGVNHYLGAGDPAPDSCQA